MLVEAGGAALERLVGVLSYLAVGSAGVKKKGKKKEHGAAAQPGGAQDVALAFDIPRVPVAGAAEPAASPSRPRAADSDENIFDSDGEEYVPTARKSAAASGPQLPGPAPLGPAAEEGELGQYPDTDAQYPSADAQYPDTNAQYPDTDAQYPDTNAQYPDTDAQYPDSADAQPAPGIEPKEQPVPDTGVSFYLAVSRGKPWPATHDE